MLFECRRPGKPRRQIPVLQLLAHWQSRQDDVKNRRPLQIFIISPLLTSLLIFPWNKRNNKVLFFPLPFHTCKSLGRDQNLLTSGIIRPRELASGIPVQWLGASPSTPCTQRLCPSSPPLSLSGMLTPLLGIGNCLLQLQPQRVEPGEASGVHLAFLSLCRALENPSQFLLLTPITIHLAPSSLGHLEPLFPDSFITNTDLVFTDFFREGSEEGDPRNNHHGFSILGCRKDSLMQPQAMWWEPRLFESDRPPLRLPPSCHTAFGACVATWPFSH